MTAIDFVMDHVKAISGGQAKVKPGQPFRFSEACSFGDTVAQGDLYLMIYEGQVPEGYVEVVEPKEEDKKLVPGQTQGSRHCLDSLSGVKLYRLENWTEDDLRGPLMILSEERTVLHPTHGAVTIPAGFSVLCSYQPSWDAEQKKIRRNAD